MTQRNFETNFPNKKADFIVSDLLTGLPIDTYPDTLFLTNLPYIKDADWKNMSPDTIFEPKLALFGGEKTGFELYEKLFEQFQ
jgi:methylase of polypeptide subunit release factors